MIYKSEYDMVSKHKHFKLFVSDIWDDVYIGCIKNCNINLDPYSYTVVTVDIHNGVKRAIRNAK